MMYIGIDVSSKSFVAHAVNERKKVVFKGEVSPTRSGLQKILTSCGKEQKVVVFEAGNQLKWIALYLQKQVGVKVHVVHPNEVKWISQSSGKTDKIDAKKLAELARGDMLPRAVHIVEGKVRKLRELISARETMQRKRVALINTIRGYLRQEGKRLPEKFFSRMDWAERLEKLQLGETQRLIIKVYREGVEALERSERELQAAIVAIEDKRIDQLESIPGIGKLTSRVMVSAYDEVRRFGNQKQAAKYGALTPRVSQSGDMLHLGRINHDGRKEVRRALLQCAHTVCRMKSLGSKPLRDFYHRIEKRRGKKRAVVALARKLLTTCYGVLKYEDYYNPERLVA